MAKWVYSFGDGKAEGRAEMRGLLGGKGANLAEMSNLGLPVPPGFTITTEVCSAYYANDRKYPDDLEARSRRRSPPSSSSQGASSATRRGRSWSPCARVHAPRCPG